MNSPSFPMGAREKPRAKNWNASFDQCLTSAYSSHDDYQSDNLVIMIMLENSSVIFGLSWKGVEEMAGEKSIGLKIVVYFCGKVVLISGKIFPSICTFKNVEKNQYLHTLSSFFNIYSLIIKQLC